MAKTKQKRTKKKGFAYSNEVIGILIILISIIGIGGYGPAGNFIKAFSIFLVGTNNLASSSSLGYIPRILFLSL